MTKSQFIADATLAALAASRTSSLPPGVTVAQAALESAWGRSRLAREAHNYFGIKAHGTHPSIAFLTAEVANGMVVQAPARFARYASMQECFRDRDLLIRKSARYREACACADRPEEFICALAVHWATDPRYAEKLLQLYHANGMSELDRGPRMLEDRLQAHHHPPTEHEAKK
jgi:flagellar protein FlgJ